MIVERRIKKRNKKQEIKTCKKHDNNDKKKFV